MIIIYLKSKYEPGCELRMAKRGLVNRYIYMEAENICPHCGPLSPATRSWLKLEKRGGLTMN